MTGTQWQENRGNRLGFLGATFLSVVFLGALIVIGLTIASGGSNDEKKIVTIAEPAGRHVDAARPAPVKTMRGDEEAIAEEGPPAPAAPGESAEITADKGASSSSEEKPISPAVTAPVSWDEAKEAFHDEEYSRAADLFTRYAEDHPSSPWGFYMLGLAQSRLDDYDGAAIAFEKAIDVDSNHVKALINYARTLIELGRAEEALAPVRRAIELDGENVQAWRVLGRTAHTLGYAEEAIDAYTEALSHDDDDTWSLNNLGLVLIESGRFEEALGPLARAVSLDDSAALFRNNLGIALERTGHPGQAAEAFARAVALDGAYEKAAVNLARVEPFAAEDAGNAPVDLEAIAASWRAKHVEAEVASTTN